MDIEENPDVIEKINESEPYYFTTSTFKFITMYLCTFGVYKYYWFYKNWVLVNNRSEEKMMPFWRAFFAPIWAYSLFREVRSDMTEDPENNPLPAGILAFFFFILQAAGRLPGAYGVITFASIIPLLPVNNAAIEINKRMTPNCTENKEFSDANWIIIVLDAIVISILILGYHALHKP